MKKVVVLPRFQHTKIYDGWFIVHNWLRVHKIQLKTESLLRIDHWSLSRAELRFWTKPKG